MPFDFIKMSKMRGLNSIIYKNGSCLTKKPWSTPTAVFHDHKIISEVTGIDNQKILGSIKQNVEKYAYKVA